MSPNIEDPRAQKQEAGKLLADNCRTRHALVCVVTGTLKINESDLRDMDQCYNIQMWLHLNYGRGFS